MYQISSNFSKLNFWSKLPRKGMFDPTFYPQDSIFNLEEQVKLDSLIDFVQEK